MPGSEPTGWSRRPKPPPPAPESETITLTTSSGVALAVEIRDVPRACSTAILLHSSMASRRTFGSSQKQGFAAFLAERGVRTLALDFRGHGESGTPAARGGKWSFDDFVREDLPALSRAARERWPRDRLTLIGHSLGGQVALAAVATSAADADGVAIMATNVWVPRDEMNPALRARKSAVIAAMRAFTRARGYFPARALRVGSDDEAASYMDSVFDCWDRDRWQSDDGCVDYFEAMERIATPVLAIASVADSYVCSPQASFRFVSRATSASVRFEVVRRADDGGDAPGHMELVTTRRATSHWDAIATFCHTA
jgi:predicted alpha/beta hydrolase